MQFQFQSKVYKKPGIRLGLIILIFLPLLFIHNRSSHDWGDDFAQYIHQAENIVKGIPQSETGFIYSELNYIGPRAYPPGFPLLLAPVYSLFGNQMLAFTVYISLFCFLLAFLVLKFYCKIFSPTAALILTIILIYNPQFLLFKQEVMSDIPFTVLLLLALLYYPKVKSGDHLNLILFSLLVGFILMVRSVGFVLLAAIAIDQLLTIYSATRKARLLKGARIPLGNQLAFPLLLLIIPVLIYFLFNSFIFRLQSGGGLHDYLLFYYSGNFLGSIPQNLEQYVEVFRYMYTPVVGDFRFAALISGSFFLTMSILGFIRRMLTRPEVHDLFFIIYVIILLFFPNNYSAYRLLLPVGFILLYYAAFGFKSIRLPWQLSSKNQVLLLGIVIGAMFIPGIVRVISARNTILEGPQQKEAVQAFEYISKNTPDNAAIVFFKPRALALYTGRKGMVDPMTPDPTAIFLEITRADAGYILIHNELSPESMKRFVRIMKSRATLTWSNSKFKLYKLNPPSPADLY
jgi:4-amino-4-deoxy-L-arabinose transferase-like glycosyltransferase